MRSLATAAILIIHLVAALNCCPAAIVVPNGLASVEGNSNNGLPFNPSLFGIPSERYQQVYAASQFASLGGPMLIGQMAFRPDVSFGNAFSSVLPDIQINLSTTSKSPDGLSATFSANIGLDDTIVHDRGALALSSADTGGGLLGPRAFDIVITFTTPFLYDPTQGNLLLDVRNFGGGGTTQFDAEETTGDSVSRILIGDVTATTGINDGRSIGLVTQFLPPLPTQPVPEPSTLALLGFGSLALALRSVCGRFHRRARAHKRQNPAV